MPPVAPQADPLLGRVLDHRYSIEAFVARGGMATVYRGVDRRLDRTVAIKVMHPSFAMDPGFVERFEREARAAARLTCPFVVAVHDQGNDSGVTYLVMEYVPGHTVRDVLRSHGALSPAQALAIVDPVLEALAAAHRAGYIHRDIKPENVLISDDGRVKVTDFGLARAIEGGDTGKTHGLLLGTVAYLSPEQVEHDRTDARSDVYGTGILLFEMLTGQVPFSAPAPMQVAYRHVHEDVPAPSAIRPDVPAELDALVHRATRRQPDARFQNADEFLTSVRAVRAQLPPVQPWSPSPTDTLVVGEAGARGQAASPGGAAQGTAPAPVSGAVASAAAGASAGPAAGATPAGSVTSAAGSGAGAAAGSVPPAAGASSDDSDATVETPAVPPVAAGHPVVVGRSEITEVRHGTAPEAPARVRRGRKTMWLGVIALVCTLGLLAFLFGPLQRVSVPNVLGRSPTEAAALLATANLKLDAQETGYSEEVPKGLIASTRPAPDASARTGSTVEAVVSKGPERYDVPDLKGLTVGEADVALGATKLDLGSQTSAFHDTVKTGLIISSTPPAKTSVKPGTLVAVEVSKGPAPVELPELEGTNGKKAVAKLKDLGLKVDRSDKTSESVAKGLVIEMDPAGGTTVHRGDTVELVVSKGPPMVTVPNVVGMSESAARRALERAGFRVAVNKPFGFSIFGVRTQSPKGGTSAPKGSTVRINVV